MTVINDDTTNVIKSGRFTSTTVAAKLSDAVGVQKATRGITIKNPAGNAADVYIGGNGSITTDAGDTTDGFPLSPGESKLFAIDSTENLWHRAATGSQRCWCEIE